MSEHSVTVYPRVYVWRGVPGYDAHKEHRLKEAQARVLDYWRAVELLSPQKLPKEDPSNREYPVFRVRSDEALPWKMSAWDQAPVQGKTWRFVLYCGGFSLAALRSILARRFGEGRESFERRQGGLSCLFAVQLTADGRPLFDTLVVSASPWALSRTLSAKPLAQDWLNGSRDWTEAQRNQIEEQWAVRQDDGEGLKLLSRHRVGRRLDHSDIAEAFRTVGSTLRLDRILKPGTNLVKAYRIPEARAFEPGGFGFLNSFFVEDLERVATQVRAGNCGQALSRVLLAPGELKETDRVDLRQREETLWEKLSPDRFPRGRWPADTRESPYFSQQLAINLGAALTDDPEGGLLGVNGPPGTGKTTLLRELAAAIVVRRAQALAALRKPGDAFEGEATWKSDRFTRVVSLWKPEFRGYEIVVASNNNRAVENVSLEIPAATAIDPEWRDTVDYFADFATRLQRKTKGGGEAWALIAARFGNKKNRRLFRDSFWFQDQEIEEPETRADRGFAAYLLNVKARASSWKDAVREFEAALQTEGRIRKERSERWAAATAVEEAKSKFRALEHQVQDQRAQVEASREQVAQREIECKRLSERRETAVMRRKEHQAFKPSMVDAVFTLGSAYRNWSSQDSNYTEQLADAEAEYEAALSSLEVERHQKSIADAKLSQAERDLAAVEKVRSSLGGADAAAWPESGDARELSSPWCDEAWNRARSALFIKALHLHRVFLECSSLRLRKNLWAAMDLLSGKIPAGVDEVSAGSVWATLFLVVPVVSTTFASFDRLFAHLGCESLGWLLMDEAGQTTPQAAVGAIWRSKRVLATGDPQQLEPIVSLPYTSQETLRNHFEVDEIWMPSQNSAQRLVDRASLYGTYLQVEPEEKAVWVGCPLRVHRRCERPMFDISNQVAYGGQMVYATPVLPSINLSRSRWLPVASEEAEGNWIPDEGLLLTVLLSDLVASGVERETILVITPFRDVSLKIRQIAKRFGIRRAGTIHVAQGAEADVVILVLGGNPTSDGAREWASERPNLLNVAVSRAKRRFYVIGNRQRWGTLPHFSQAAELLQEKKLHASV